MRKSRVSSYVLEICHQTPGKMLVLKHIEMSNMPPFYPDGTSFAVDDQCFTVMSTVVSVDEHPLDEGTVIITHQVRLQ